MIDVGTNTGVLKIDFEGEARLSSPAVDIGVDEVNVSKQ